MTFYGESKYYDEMTYEEIYDEVWGYCGIEGEMKQPFSEILGGSIWQDLEDSCTLWPS